MRRIAKIVSFLTVGAMMSACGQYIKREQTFVSRPVSSADDLAVEISMRGTWSESDSGKDRHATSAAPFTLRIGVRGRRLDAARTRLEDVAIVAADGDTTSVARVSRMTLRDRSGNELGTSLGVVSARWEELTVLGVVVVEDGSGTERRFPFATVLEPVLKESRSSRLWARLSGV